MNKELMDQYFPGVGLNEFNQDITFEKYQSVKLRTITVVATILVIGLVYEKLIREQKQE